MDRTMITEHLAQARRHVALGEDHITRQQRVVSEIEARDDDAKEARDQLALFEEMQAEHIGTRDRLARELRELNGASSAGDDASWT
jgi:hypothetical protein